MIELQDVKFGYRKKKVLFPGLSLSLDEGHVCGLLGSNGSGKTTLLKLICGALRPRSGMLRLFGKNPSRRLPSLYRELFFIPEEFELPSIDFRSFVRTTSPFYPSFSHEALTRYVEALDVDPQCRLNALSMGQKKRAFIAFALACNVRLLIMDEPTNGLDIPSKTAFRRLVAAYADAGHSVLISTHQVRDLDLLIDHVVILDSQGVLLNASLDRISAKLRFGTLTLQDKALYREESLQGPMGVVENTSGSESKVDLELLYNTAVHNRERMHNLFHA